MTSVILVAKAAQQLREIDAWWRDHRPDAVTLVADEFERCVELLENTPGLGAPFRKTSVFGVRRLVMKKTKHLVYYVHDSVHSVVYIIAVWGMPKEGSPSLDDPR
jgi:plasmid stabilization system protein ParE